MEFSNLPADPPVRFSHSSVSELFPTLIWLADLAPDMFMSLNGAILAKLDALTGPRTQSYRSETFQTETRLHQLPEFEPLVRAIGQVAGGALRQLAIDASEMVFTAMWANINPPGTKHSVHAHPNNFFSGIYYLKFDHRSNVTRFYDPRPQAEVMMPPRVRDNPYNGNVIELEARPGRLALFPAWLKHDVPTNLGDGERITIAFNLMFPQFTQRMAEPIWVGGKDKRPRVHAKTD